MDTAFGWGTFRKETTVNIRHRCEATLQLSARNRTGGLGLDSAAQDKTRWQTLVNVIMNLRVP